MTETNEDITTQSNKSRIKGDTRLRGAMAGQGPPATEAFYSLLGGLLFGMVSPIVGHPFDTVKTKMQGEVRYQNASMMKVVKSTYMTEGLRGFYRGFVPPLVGSAAYRGLLFSSYAGAYAACEGTAFDEPFPYSGGLRPSVLVGGLAAAAARSIVESPLDFVKVRKQTGGHWRVGNSKTKQFRSIISIQQLQYAYQGFTPTFLRTWGLVGSFFIMVDYSVRIIPDVINAPLFGPFFKGGICATTAWVFAFPFETVKSVIQADVTGEKRSLGTWNVLKNIYSEKGVRGLYRGFGPGAGRSFIANGTSMMVYSVFQDWIRQE